MTTVLKFDALHGGELVRPLDQSNNPFADQTVVEDPEITALKAEVIELRRTLALTEADHAVALDSARAEGQAIAQAEHRRNDERALNALSTTLDKANKALNERLGDAEKLGILFSANALEKVVGDASRYRDLVGECVSIQVEGLRRGAILSVRVSPSDFGDRAAIDALADKLGFDRQNISCDPALAQGDCHIELRLGAIELSVGKYWRDLQTLCRQLLDGTDL